MGGPRGSGRVITRVFSLHVGFSRHFTRLRHTLKRVILCCFSLLFVVEIGRVFNLVLHYLGLFFYPGQFKSCFPHQSKTSVKTEVFVIFGGQKTGFECNFECNWS